MAQEYNKDAMTLPIKVKKNVQKLERAGFIRVSRIVSFQATAEHQKGKFYSRAVTRMTHLFFQIIEIKNLAKKHFILGDILLQPPALGTMDTN